MARGGYKAPDSKKLPKGTKCFMKFNSKGTPYRVCKDKKELEFENKRAKDNRKKVDMLEKRKKENKKLELDILKKKAELKKLNKELSKKKS